MIYADNASIGRLGKWKHAFCCWNWSHLHFVVWLSWDTFLQKSVHFSWTLLSMIFILLVCNPAKQDLKLSCPWCVHRHEHGSCVTINVFLYLRFPMQYACGSVCALTLRFPYSLSAHCSLLWLPLSVSLLLRLGYVPHFLEKSSTYYWSIQWPAMFRER